MKKIFTFISICIFCGPLYAEYNANFRGEILEVLTYTDSTRILIKVENQPNQHPQCSKFDYLVIPSDIPAENRQIILSRILLAYASGEIVNIGYDKTGSCVGPRIRLYRVG